MLFVWCRCWRWWHCAGRDDLALADTSAKLHPSVGAVVGVRVLGLGK